MMHGGKKLRPITCSSLADRAEERDVPGEHVAFFISSGFDEMPEDLQYALDLSQDDRKKKQMAKKSGVGHERSTWNRRRRSNAIPLLL
jgi:hypothetical protein